MAKKKIEEEEVAEIQTEVASSLVDPVTLKADEILGIVEDGMAYEGIRLNLRNSHHLIVAAWLVGRGGWLRK